MVSVSDVSSRDGLETYQRLVSVSSRLREVSVSVSSRNSLTMSRSRLGLGAERLGLGLGLGLEGLVHIPAEHIALHCSIWAFQLLHKPAFV